MSEAQAIETEVIETEEVSTDVVTIDQPEVQETELKTEQVEEVEEVEIVAEGEDEPTSKPLKKDRIPRRVGKLKREIEEKDSELGNLSRRIEMQEEELKLLRLSTQKPETSERPNEDDFDSVEDYRKAETVWLQDQINAAAEAKTTEKLTALQSNNAQTQANQTLDNSIDEHYERAEKLKVADYSEAEGVAAEIFGDEKSKIIIANTDRSELLMYHLGKNPVKAEKYSQMLSNPATMVRALMELGGIANRLTAVPKTKPAPDPETEVPGGKSITHAERGPVGAKFW